ncbi:hypothetical protein [Halalkalicoccus jeotgali]|uniref:Uncharacterized protein n=1 Tax=Halalkalicoccus jeotgali (strain DSM 18796 / CECT 7217 / JCM 14584 / KCTC 4019 / B3) TaxID=795797 RepID=D8J9X1_HALJB|nr:hypothetical protein [Halalkalicoccus jeotgali]ADJ14493.1 hypothetical protein HacjB3_05510 [Halalkalicoccus jeotgali B3]ELY40207.1 hypothetical protein C497_03885 [Halalkalicoccus jeotgali B3]
MGYTATCNKCDDKCTPAPGLLGQFSPQFFRTTEIGGRLAEMGYSESTTITLCGECTYELLMG